MSDQAHSAKKRPRRLVLVLGDQLTRDAVTFDEFDPKVDAVWMAEVAEEATHVSSHQVRIALFFSAMRHFRDDLRERGITVHYHELTHRKSEDRGRDLATVLRKDIHRLRPEKLSMTQPGDWRVDQSLRGRAKESGVELEVLPDRHFCCSIEEFRDWADGRKEFLLETFYRRMRQEHGVLITEAGKPAGGEWNYDKENRESFAREGPGEIKAPRSFRPDATTRKVMELVERRFGNHPGTLEHFDLPVTHGEALAALRDFVEHRLARFGPYQDALWTDRPFLYHSRLSAALNLKLIDPRACIEKAIEAYESGNAPLNSVEGFVRQILGWREFVRGIYWYHMPDYLEMNHLGHSSDVPSFYWDGETDMECLRQSMQSVLNYAYAHHIQRLMVLGLFALLYGTDPRKFHEWHMAMYADAVDWVSLPNALGMSQYGDGGIVGTKPYCASGNYINRMGNCCKHCRYRYDKAVGNDACPFTALYWDFLDRHYDRLKENRRLAFQVKNLERKRKSAEMEEILAQAAELKKRWNPQRET